MLFGDLNIEICYYFLYPCYGAQFFFPPHLNFLFGGIGFVWVGSLKILHFIFAVCWGVHHQVTNGCFMFLRTELFVGCTYLPGTLIGGCRYAPIHYDLHFTHVIVTLISQILTEQPYGQLLVAISGEYILFFWTNIPLQDSIFPEMKKEEQ